MRDISLASLSSEVSDASLSRLETHTCCRALPPHVHSTVNLPAKGPDLRPGYQVCAHHVYKILNEILIVILERTYDDIQQRKCRVEVTIVWGSHTLTIIILNRQVAQSTCSTSYVRPECVHDIKSNHTHQY